MNFRQLLDLYVTFFKVGGMTFGGGYAMMPILEREVVQNKGWATTEDLVNYYAIGQCTPGIIAVNTATFIGYRTERIPGAICATLGVVSPSIVIISIIAGLLGQVSDNVWVQHAFAGIRIAVVALVVQTIIKMLKTSVSDALGVILFLAAFLVVAILGLSSVWVVIAAAFIGVAYQTARVHFRKDKEEQP
jgi:chromate transporter